MKSRLVSLAIIWGVIACSPVAWGQAYVGTVLYPLIAPGGYSFSTPNTDQISGGQTVLSGASAGAPSAVLWTPAGNLVVLNPDGFTASFASSTDGNLQVGYGFTSDTGLNQFGGHNYNALMWNGTAASAVNLNPTGFTTSQADGAGGNQEVGFGTGTATGGSTEAHALLWTGTATSAVQLNPAGYLASVATATNGSQQVGYGTSSGAGNEALLWNSTAASAVDLGPGAAFGISPDGSQQVGFDAQFPTLWTGTPGSAVDLTPTDLSGFVGASVRATNGVNQVGWGDSTKIQFHHEAMVWSGTGSSAIDLQPMVPGFWNSTWACSIDSAGNIYGLAFGGYNGVDGNYAVEWSPVPEPASVSILGIIGVGIMMRRPRCARK